MKTTPHVLDHEVADPIWSRRFIIAIVVAAVGIAWIAYYYAGVRDLSHHAKGIEPFKGLKGWNYLIGFLLLGIGLVIASDKSTPLGRGKGLVATLLTCFLIGLVWICIYYIWNTDLNKIWVFNDLDQKNLLVGIGFMAVGFAYATKWE